MKVTLFLSLSFLADFSSYLSLSKLVVHRLERVDGTYLGRSCYQLYRPLFSNWRDTNGNSKLRAFLSGLIGNWTGL